VCLLYVRVRSVPNAYVLSFNPTPALGVDAVSHHFIDGEPEAYSDEGHTQVSKWLAYVPCSVALESRHQGLAHCDP